jgi:hypothetical protein
MVIMFDTYERLASLDKWVRTWLRRRACAWRSGPPVAAPGAGDRHVDPLGHLTPGEALITKLHDLIGGGGMSGRTCPTHCDSSPTQLITDRGLRDAQLGTDLAQSPTMGVQVGRTLNVHGGSVTSLYLTSV